MDTTELLSLHILLAGIPGGSVVKNPPGNAGDKGFIPGLGRSPGGGNVNSFQYSCLGNPMDRAAWWATVHGVSKSSTHLSNGAHMPAVLPTTYLCLFLFIFMFPRDMNVVLLVFYSLSVPRRAFL